MLIVAGLAAIAFPLLGTIAAKIMLGWLFLIGGVMMIMHAFQAPGWQGFLWELLVGILYVIAGGYLAFFPLTGLLTLAIVLAVLFIAEGIFEVIQAFRVRPHEGWFWLLLSGIAALAVGVLIALGLPGSASGRSDFSSASTFYSQVGVMFSWRWLGGARTRGPQRHADAGALRA